LRRWTALRRRNRIQDAPQSPTGDSLDSLLGGPTSALGHLCRWTNSPPTSVSRPVPWPGVSLTSSARVRVLVALPAGGCGTHPPGGYGSAGRGDRRSRGTLLCRQPPPPLPRPGRRDPRRLPASVLGIHGSQDRRLEVRCGPGRAQLRQARVNDLIEQGDTHPSLAASITCSNSVDRWVRAAVHDLRMLCAARTAAKPESCPRTHCSSAKSAMWSASTSTSGPGSPTGTNTPEFLRMKTADETFQRLPRPARRAPVARAAGLTGGEHTVPARFPTGGRPGAP
jgi:hypothetical protein